MLNLKQATATAAIALCASFAAAGSAKADTVYGGGSTLASVVYRALMDTWSFPMVSPSGCGATSTDLGHNSFGQPEVGWFFAAEGSGAGKRALVNNSGSTSTSTGLGSAAPSVPPPWTLSASCTTTSTWTGYPSFHFAGSDDVINASDVAAYNANSGPTKWGKLIEIPAFVTPVDIAFNPTGLNLPGATLNLTRKQVCGIFSGHITDWSDPIFATSGASGGPLSAGQPITVVHRADGSGTSFLLTNGLKAQCAGIVGPTNAFSGNTTPALWELSWSDRTVASSQCPAIPTRGSNQLNWPDLGTTQCGTAISNSGGGTFVGATHTDQVSCTIATTTGGIGYVSPDFAQPVKTTLTSCTTPNVTAPLGAAVQNQYSVDNDLTGTINYTLPTATNASNAMASASPIFLTDAAITNPLNWSTQGVVPNPLGQNSYPYSGFTWLDFYQCYNGSTANGNVLGDIQAFLTFYFGGLSSGTAANILTANGFSQNPSVWDTALTNLLSSSSAKFGVGGSGVCSGIPGA